MSVERFAALSLNEKCQVVMTAAFIVACAAIAYGTFRMGRPSALDKAIEKRLKGNGDEPEGA